MSSLDTLFMSNNNFVGEVPIEIMSINSLFVLHLSNNNLSGCFSSFNLSATFLEFIDLSHNKISGHIPRPTNGNLTSYTSFRLVIRDNSFFGPFPCELFMAVYILDISYNSLTGELPACSGFNYDIEVINLYGNKFTGLVPKTIFNSSSLRALNIGNNFFSGKIPILIHDQSPLQVLLLRGNHFTGPIPNQFCKLQKLNVLDLSHNSFSGLIPTCFGNSFSFGKMATSLSDFEINYYRSFIPDAQYTLTYKYDVEFLSKHRMDAYTGGVLSSMSGLDLSSNNLEGQIPDALGNLSDIHALNLSNNRLSGHIPQTFSNLRQIESLDLSHNSLSGEIPSNLVNLNFMGTFSVAYNNLSGIVPEGKAQFGSFGGDTYAGNPFLCGPPLEDCKVEVKDKNNDDEHIGNQAWYNVNDREGFLASFMATYIVYILGFMAVLWINPRWRIRWFTFTEELWFSSYYFLSDSLYKCFRVRI